MHRRSNTCITRIQKGQKKENRKGKDNQIFSKPRKLHETTKHTINLGCSGNVKLYKFKQI